MTLPVSQYATIAELQKFGLPGKALTGVPPDVQLSASQAASGYFDGYIATRNTLPLLAWGLALTQAVCWIAAEDIIVFRGFNPSVGADGTLTMRADRARKFAEDYGASKQNMVVRDSGSPVNTQPAPYVTSDCSEGWAAMTGGCSQNRGY